MRPLRFLLPALALMAAPLPSQSPGAGSVPERLTFEHTLTRQVRLPYLLHRPEGYSADPAKKWPLVLFLHGAGERGSDLDRLMKHGPPKLVREGKRFPFLLVAPQCPDGQRWEPDALFALLDAVSATERVDASRVYVTGLSMGGFATWAMAAQRPERFAAVAPICGGGQIIDVLLAGRSKAEALASLGVWAFHGAKDPVVPLAESERMVDAFRRAGVRDLKLTVYPEAQHDSWTQAYADPVFWEWLLGHQRGGA